MWIVRLALRRPYTFVVAALLLLLLTPFVLLRTPADIFPVIDIPVVSVVWTYDGLSAQEIEQRILYQHERGISTLVDNIEHIESTAYNGATVIKVFLQPSASGFDAGGTGGESRRESALHSERRSRREFSQPAHAGALALRPPLRLERTVCRLREGSI